MQRKLRISENGDYMYMNESFFQQLVLETTPTPVDTIVMENLGYFQLKAQPGAWDLSIADGRSSELYQFGDMEHHEVSDTGRVAVEVGGFQGRNLK